LRYVLKDAQALARGLVIYRVWNGGNALSSSDLQVQIDSMTTILSSDFGKLITDVGIISLICLLLVVRLSYFFDSLSEYNRNRRAANHCDDLHRGVKQGRCHYNDCTFRAGCPYFEKLTLCKRWKQFRAKRNKPD